MSRKVKVVKKNPEPAQPANVNPGQLGQYSATSQVSEDSSLTAYLSSRGIDAKNLPKDTKISHAKSSQFLAWKKNHMVEEVLDEDATLDQYLLSRGINPQHLTTNQKVAYSKSGAFITWKQHHMHEEVSTKSPTVDKHQNLKKQKASGEIMHTNPIRKEGSQTPQMTPEHVVKSGSGYKLLSKKTGKSLGTAKTKAGIEKRERQVQFFKHQHEEVQLEAKTIQGTALDKFRQAAAERQKKHDEIEKKQSKDGSGVTSAIDRLEKHMNKEDIMDPQAAIAKVPDTDPSISERTRQLSKSARMIKALYKKKGMVREDLYDHEKEDKSVATYGKKPKFDKADEKDSAGESKPAAAATMTGGTTLTGTKRDDIEIDPMMRLRPGQPDPFKKDDKKKDDKKDGKKEEKK